MRGVRGPVLGLMERLMSELLFRPAGALRSVHFLPTLNIRGTARHAAQLPRVRLSKSDRYPADNVSVSRLSSWRGGVNEKVARFGLPNGPAVPIGER
jgi:hypothetical protein